MNHKLCNTIKLADIEYKVLHEDLVPNISNEEFQRLKDDIASNGVLVPIVIDEKKGILDGVNRLRAASELGMKSVPFHMHYGLDQTGKRDITIKLNSLRRNWTKEERLDLAIQLRKDKYSFRRIGAVLNLSHESVRRHLKDLGDTQDFPDTIIGKDGKERSSKPSVVSIKNKAEANKAFNALSDLDGKLEPFNSIIDVKAFSKRINTHNIDNIDTSNCSDVDFGKDKIILGDFREKGHEIADESVDMVFVDPPYGKDFLPLWEDLGEFAQKILKPGGILLSYSGNLYLPQIHEMLGKNLTYFWTFAVKHTGGNTLVRELDLQQTYKPILAYYKPPFKKSWKPFCDMVSGGRSKSHHEWEQPVEEAYYFIKNMCPNGGTLVDPMMGSSSSILAGMALGMDTIGIEIDTTAFVTAQERIRDLKQVIGKKAA